MWSTRLSRRYMLNSRAWVWLLLGNQLLKAAREKYLCSVLRQHNACLFTPCPVSSCLSSLSLMTSRVLVTETKRKVLAGKKWAGPNPVGHGLAATLLSWTKGKVHQALNKISGVVANICYLCSCSVLLWKTDFNTYVLAEYIQLSHTRFHYPFPHFLFFISTLYPGTCWQCVLITQTAFYFGNEYRFSFWDERKSILGW